VYMPFSELVDLEKEIERLEQEKKKLEGEIERIAKKLGNQGFVAKAPEAVIVAEKDKSNKYQSLLDNVLERLEKLSKNE
ncbi:MAG: hypothetical protein JW708_12170, partial [Vallitaleaceae bacterium]|nr:hypothetical protein [Vallitaleaceae bacterium]